MSLVVKLKKFMNDASCVEQMFSGEESAGIQDSFEFSQQIRELARKGAVSFAVNADEQEWKISKMNVIREASRFEQVGLNEGQKASVEHSIQYMKQLESFINDRVTDPRYKAMILTDMEKLHMLINKGISRST